jgi:hypothetical protein
MERQELDASVIMNRHIDDDAGVGLIETMIALLVLTVGALGLAGVFAAGIKTASSGPGELMATQKAAEGIESVFSARDTHTIAWTQVRNTNNGGIFLKDAQEIREPGKDGIVNTADDAAAPIESARLPGIDQVINTIDDKIETLAAYTRQIVIADLTDDLRSITVIVTYKAGPTTQTYTLTAYISRFA